MRHKKIATVILALLACGVAGSGFISMAHGQERPDFLSPGEADKIRDAQNPNERVKLFLNFAADRIKKLQYELQLKTPQLHRNELVNGLLNGYSDCMDEAADRIQEGRDAGTMMRPAINDMRKRGKQYWGMLQKVESTSGPELSAFKDSLDDAIDATRDAVKEANKASKEYGAVPVRRKP